MKLQGEIETQDYFEDDRFLLSAVIRSVIGKGLICDYIRGTTAPLHIWYRAELDENKGIGNEYPFWEFRRRN